MIVTARQPTSALAPAPQAHPNPDGAFAPQQKRSGGRIPAGPMEGTPPPVSNGTSSVAVASRRRLSPSRKAGSLRSPRVMTSHAPPWRRFSSAKPNQPQFPSQLRVEEFFEQEHAEGWVIGLLDIGIIGGVSRRTFASPLLLCSPLAGSSVFNLPHGRLHSAKALRGHVPHSGWSVSLQAVTGASRSSRQQPGHHTPSPASPTSSCRNSAPSSSSTAAELRHSCRRCDRHHQCANALHPP